MVAVLNNAEPEDSALFRIEEIMLAIAGKHFRGNFWSAPEVTEAINAWWKANRETWRPPIPPLTKRAGVGRPAGSLALREPPRPLVAVEDAVEVAIDRRCARPSRAARR